MNKNYVVLGKDGCQWCDKVADLFDAKGISYFGINIIEDDGFIDFLEQSGLETVPQVYLNGNRIGGYEDTMKHFEEVARQ